MKMNWTVAVLAACGAVGAALPAHAGNVTYERLLAADNEPQNWLSNTGNYSNWAYSKLNQITKANVGSLQMKFMFSIGRDTKADGQEEGRPLVEDGFMYVTNAWSKLMKVDVRSGKEGVPIWRFDPKSEFVRSNKGPGLLGNNVYITTNDVRLFALNKDSGEVVFEKNMVATTESNTQRTTPGPMMVKNLALVSESTGGQSGTRRIAAIAQVAQPGEAVQRIDPEGRSIGPLPGRIFRLGRHRPRAAVGGELAAQQALAERRVAGPGIGRHGEEAARRAVAQGQGIEGGAQEPAAEFAAFGRRAGGAGRHRTDRPGAGDQRFTGPSGL